MSRGAGADGEAEVCPVCQEALPAELAVLPCGHPLCHACAIRLVDRVAANRVGGFVAVSRLLLCCCLYL